MERLTFPFGEVYCDEELRGVALWTPPGKWRLHWWEQLRDLPSWGRAIGWSRLAFMGKATAQLTAAHPSEPHFYLLALGVDAAHRGQGLASALVKPVLARCDEQGMPAYLEASRPELVPLYQHLGFELQREVRLGTDGPPMFLMWRPGTTEASSSRQSSRLASIGDWYKQHKNERNDQGRIPCSADRREDQGTGRLERQDALPSPRSHQTG